MWAFAYMKGWKSNENVDFNFHNAHDLKPLTDRASDETVYRRLRERFYNAKQVIVIVADTPKPSANSCGGRSKSLWISGYRSLPQTSTADAEWIRTAARRFCAMNTWFTSLSRR